ncbi:hypothetical protein V6O07_13765, partial [Arthrospira platensis SPKY2]
MVQQQRNAGSEGREIGHPRPGLLCVANFAPDVGYAWWLMENFWVRLSRLAGNHGLRTIIAYPAEGEVPTKIHQAGIETAIQAFPGSGWRQLW